MTGCPVERLMMLMVHGQTPSPPALVIVPEMPVAEAWLARARLAIRMANLLMVCRSPSAVSRFDMRDRACDFPRPADPARPPRRSLLRRSHPHRWRSRPARYMRASHGRRRANRASCCLWPDNGLGQRMNEEHEPEPGAAWPAAGRGRTAMAADPVRAQEP